MPEPTLTIGLLVGRESELLERCLAELEAVRLPKLVVTNFDRRATRRACDAHGAVCDVFTAPGPFSFARQRNRLFEGCRTPWLLMLDVDETITPRDLEAALELSRRPPERAFVPRHVFLGPRGPLAVDEQPRLLPGDGRFRFEGHVANTLDAEHQRGEALSPANFEISDRGALLSPEKTETRRARFLELAGHERRRLLALAAARDPRSYCRLGFRHHVMGRNARALPYLRASLRELPGRPTAEYLLARVEEKALPEGRERALRRLLHLAEAGTRDYRVYRALARLHRAERDWKGLARAAELALGHHPEAAAFHHLRAVARHAQGDVSGAAAAHADSLRLFPDYRPALAFERALELASQVPA